jgi:hypothetical protein
MKGRVAAFAIVRLDKYLVREGVVDWAMAITVKEVVASQAMAESEVARLNSGVDPEDRVYFWQYTRLQAPFESEATET